MSLNGSAVTGAHLHLAAVLAERVTGESNYDRAALVPNE